MKTIALYMQDDYIRTFQAKIVSARQDAIVLDRTAFYPTGGHQACDLGNIVKGTQCIARVTNVEKAGPVVVHNIELVSGSFTEGDDIEGEIDWERRYYHMQLHTAQHIFSRCFLTRFGGTTWRSDLSPEGGLIVMDNPITVSEITAVEADVAEVISRAELVQRVLHGDRAQIQIGEFSTDECGGTHVRDTSEIGFFKVHRIDERNVYYQVGRRAIDMVYRMANCSLAATKILGLDDFGQIPDKLLQMVGQCAAQQEAIDELQERLTQIQIQLALTTTRQLAGIEVLLLDLRHLHSKRAKGAISPQQKDGRVILCTADNNSVLVWSGSSSISARNMMAILSDQWSVKGGGNHSYAQGGPYPDRIVDPLNELFQLLVGLV